MATGPPPPGRHTRRLLLFAAFWLAAGAACDHRHRGGTNPVGVGIRPALPSVPIGATLPLRVVASYANGVQVDLADHVRWRSTAPTIASIDQNGVATGLTLGATTIEALDTRTRDEHTVTLVVTPAAVAAVAVTPPQPRLARGTTRPLTATATMTDGTIRDVTTEVQWSSSDPNVATIDEGGVVAAAEAGTTSIRAVFAATGAVAEIMLLVTPAVLVAIAVTPPSPSIALGTTQSFLATGTFSDSTVQDLTTSVAWSSSAASVATIDGNGLATSLTTGSTTVRATHAAAGLFGDAALTVTPATLQSLAVSPTSPSIALGTTRPFVATGTFSDGSTQDLTSAVAWTSSAPATATIGNSTGSHGLATSQAVGTTTVRAAHAASGLSDETVLTVTPAVLQSIDVQPSSPSIALGTSLPFTATGTFSDASTQDLTDGVTWTSATPAVATISNASGSQGLATSQGVGATTVRATHAATGVFGEAALTITPAVLQSIAVTPSNAALLVGATLGFTATGTYGDGSTQDLTTAVTWSSSATGTATISNAGGSQGVATGGSAGATTITATHAASGVNGGTTLTVFDQITLRAASSAGAGSGVLSLTIGTPPGTIADDLLLAAIAIRPQTASVTPPSGWTLVRRNDNAAGASNSLLVYRRVATSAEPTSHTWSFSASTGSAGGISCLAWVDTTTPIDVHGGQSTPSSLSHAAPTVTSTVANAMLVTVHGFSSAATWTSPTGMAEAFDVRSQALGATGIAVSAHSVLWPSAGATGSRTAVASNDADTGNTASIVLRRRP
jgi:hypothetical protein